MRMTRKRQSFYNQTDPQHIQTSHCGTQQCTKLNTNKPTAPQKATANTTANKTASTVLLTELAKLDAAELEATEPQAMEQGDDDGNDGRT